MIASLWPALGERARGGLEVDLEGARHRVLVA